MAIQTFADDTTQSFFESGRTKKGVGWSAIKNIVARKLDMLDFAANLKDMRSPPGNRLEALHGDLEGHHSIRINDQWRIVFRWADAGPEEVKVTDYR